LCCRGRLNCCQEQNCIANLQVNYNTSRVGYSLPRFPPVIKAFARRLTVLSWFEGSVPGKNLPLRPLPCLLLKPISAHHAHCPICSHYRPTRASVLSGHIDSVSVAAIICHAPQLSLLRVTLPGLPFTARPTVSRRSYGPHNPSQASYDRFSLPLTKVEHLSSLLRMSCCACSPVPALPVVQILLCL
jgi:hypothetical protein